MAADSLMSDELLQKRVRILSLESVEFSVCSVVDLDPYVFGPSGSRSVIICTETDPSINKQASKKNLDFYYFIYFF
jgi:hypothetical protein